LLAALHTAFPEPGDGNAADRDLSREKNPRDIFLQIFISIRKKNMYIYLFSSPFLAQEGKRKKWGKRKDTSGRFVNGKTWMESS